MKTSQAGIALIKRFEGCKLEGYQDIVGVWTIGYGSTKGVSGGMTITQQEAEDMLAQRLADEFEPGVMQAVGDAPTTQSQFDAMVSLAWNIGIGAFAKSSVARRHREGNYDAAARVFGLWNKAGGRVVGALVKRRAAEAMLYSTDVPRETPVDDIDLSAIARDIQQALQDAGLYEGQVDGKWGPASRAAYDEFNRRV